jgi:hypothetical protein
VVVNVTAADASSFRASQGQIAAELAHAIDSPDAARDQSHRDRITAQASPQHAFFNSSSHELT